MQRTLFGRPPGIVLICLQKSVWCLALVAIMVILLTLHAHHIAHPLRRLFAGELAEDPHDLLANALLTLVPNISPRSEVFLATGAGVYAALEAIETWGLWRDLLWVELLVVAETAAFLPYEGWEMVQHGTLLKLISVAINLLILWYLVARYLRKRERHVRRRQQWREDDKLASRAGRHGD